MTASKFLVVPILTCILLLIDWYVWQAVKVVFQNSGPHILAAAKWFFFGFSALVLAGLWAYNFIKPEVLGVHMRTIILAALSIIYGSKLISVAFIIMDDVLRLCSWLQGLISANPDHADLVANGGKSITRSEFLMKTALIAAAIPAGTLTWGILSGAHDYRIRRIRLTIKNLPAAFEGLSIAQISDIHSGSFFNRRAVKGGVELLLGEKPDLIFFTGDLVNDSVGELNEYVDLFIKISAPLGVYSVLGNHDYGVYARWPSAGGKARNLRDLKKAHGVLGYDLLLDENRILTLGGEKLAIIGVENCSANESLFVDNGNLAKAVEGTDEAAVKFLLSHDPTHWDKEVNTDFKNIDVTFSGHTHGSQFGITLGGKEYSPSQWTYKQWGGLYQSGEQQLYVNRGFGYLAYPGRVGMPPEITIFELARS